MLVLSRRVGEKIEIGKDIVIEVLKLPGGRVKLGITAPAHLRVVRSELPPLPPPEPTHGPQPTPQPVAA